MKFQSPAENLFLTTTRIETTGKNTSGIATGFCFQYNIDKKGIGVRFFVTNKHVIENKHIITLHTPIANPDGTPDLTKRFTVQSLEKQWIKHESLDLALIPASGTFNEMEKLGKPLAQKTFNNSHIPSKSQWEDFDAIEDIMFIGYPNGIWDSENMLPVLRTGTTASPVNHDWGNHPRFLIDAGVYPGSSGSPVFLYNRGNYVDKRGNTIISSRFFLLGILEKGFILKEYGEIEEINIPTSFNVKYKDMMNLGTVLKSSVIQDFAQKIVDSLEIEET